MVELTGLEPGETYYYRARSQGKDARPRPFDLIAGNAVGTSDFGLAAGGAYSFTVPKPSPGRFLFSIACGSHGWLRAQLPQDPEPAVTRRE